MNDLSNKIENTLQNFNQNLAGIMEENVRLKDIIKEKDIQINKLEQELDDLYRKISYGGYEG